MATNDNTSVEQAATAFVMKAAVGFLAIVGFFTVTAVAVISILWFFSEVIAG